MEKSIAIICGGGPAPGINTVISTLAKTFLKDGYQDLGVHEGNYSVSNLAPHSAKLILATKK